MARSGSTVWGITDGATVGSIKGVQVSRAAAALAAAPGAAIFTVTGRCLITQILGEVTVVVQTQACNAKITSNPTAAGASVDLCAVLNISALAVASLLGISGVAADALVAGLAIIGQTTPVVVQAGTIEFLLSATNTGSVKWTVTYVPLDPGASIVAA